MDQRDPLYSPKRPNNDDLNKRRFGRVFRRRQESYFGYGEKVSVRLSMLGQRIDIFKGMGRFQRT